MSQDAKRDARSLKWRGRVRLLVRGACLVGAILLLWPTVKGAPLSILVPALSPFVAVAAVLSTRSLHTAALLGLAVGVAVLVRRRLFCRWVCPMGLCMDAASRLGRRLGRRPYRGASLGQWLLLLTLGGAFLGYPIFLWLDPLAIFASVFDPAVGGSWLSATAFFVVFTLSIVRPHLWCGRACPLGALQDLLHQAPRSLCAVIGPKTGEASGLSRRAVLGAAVGAGAAGIVKVIGGQPRRPLRPPGARDEFRFLGVCTRCGNCVRACPSGIIERDMGRNGWASLLTPVLSFRDDYCREDCTRCTRVCPSGALERLLAADKARMRLGLPRVDMNICVLADDRECSACARSCPYDAIRYVFSPAQYTLSPQIDVAKCIGCGACEAACPTAPKKAIVILPASTARRLTSSIAVSPVPR